MVVNKPKTCVSNDLIYYSDMITNLIERIYYSQTHKIIENGYFENWFIQNGRIYYVNKDAQAISRES